MIVLTCWLQRSRYRNVHTVVTVEIHVLVAVAPAKHVSVAFTQSPPQQPYSWQQSCTGKNIPPLDNGNPR